MAPTCKLKPWIVGGSTVRQACFLGAGLTPVQLFKGPRQAESEVHLSEELSPNRRRWGHIDFGRNTNQRRT
jgi:hypothetical protein